MNLTAKDLPFWRRYQGPLPIQCEVIGFDGEVHYRCAIASDTVDEALATRGVSVRIDTAAIVAVVLPCVQPLVGDAGGLRLCGRPARQTDGLYIFCDECAKALKSHHATPLSEEAYVWLVLAATEAAHERVDALDQWTQEEKQTIAARSAQTATDLPLERLRGIPAGVMHAAVLYVIEVERCREHTAIARALSLDTPNGRLVICEALRDMQLLEMVAEDEAGWGRRPKAMWQHELPEAW